MEVQRLAKMVYNARSQCKHGYTLAELAEDRTKLKSCTSRK